MNISPRRFLPVCPFLAIAVLFALPRVATAQTLAATPATVSFGDVVAGTSASRTQTIKNTGKSLIKILQVTEYGSGFSIDGVSAPLELEAGHSLTFTVQFDPDKVVGYSGSIVVLSSATDYRLSIPLSGSGSTSGSVSISPSSLAFGNVRVGSSATKTLTVTANGTSMTVDSDTLSSSEYSISGLTLPLKLDAGKSVSFKATFTPQSTGTANGKIALTVASPKSTITASLSGAGTAGNQPSVSLAWHADSSSSIAGYNVYRGKKANGSFTRLNSSLDTTTDYMDTSVAAGNTYYYQVTAVNEKGQESAPSKPVPATVP